MATGIGTNQICPGLLLARAFAAKRPSPAWSEIAPYVRLGAYLRPLPQSPEAAGALVRTMFDHAMYADPRWMDTPPRIETRFGDLPVVLDPDRCNYLKELHANPAGRGGKNERLLLAAIALDVHLRGLEEEYNYKIQEFRNDLMYVEMIAFQYLSHHLTSNLQRVQDAREKYLQPGLSMPWLKGPNPFYQSLQKAIKRINDARAELQLDKLELTSDVISAIAMATTAISVMSSWQRGAILLDQTAWKQINAANALSKKASQEAARAMTLYLQVLRREAAIHPIVLVLNYKEVNGNNLNNILRHVADAIENAEESIANIRKGASSSIFPEGSRRPLDVSCSGLAERLADSGTLSVWKLPFFSERALQHLPPNRAANVLAIMQLAADLNGGKAIKNSLALLGVEAAASVAPAAGPIGLGLALAWALFSLGQSFHEYSQMKDLFQATLDPAVLLQGSGHEDPSAFGVVLDFIGLLTVK